VGFFGTYLYSEGAWSTVDPDAFRGAEPLLRVDIHDSDFTTVTYAPRGIGTGTAYLGFTPRTYFDIEDASAPTDVDLEGRGLAAWWALHHPEATAEDQLTKQREITAFLAADEELSDEELSDDADVFVEIKTARFLAAMGLPSPPDLPSS
jgi:hypothetical protein